MRVRKVALARVLGVYGFVGLAAPGTASALGVSSLPVTVLPTSTLTSTVTGVTGTVTGTTGTVTGTLPSGPLNTGLPVISPLTPVVGDTLTCSQGSWFPSPTSVSYSWQRDLTTAIGGSSNQYTTTSADVGHLITCTVSASDATGTSTATSLPVTVLPAISSLPTPSLFPIETSPPVISGAAQSGQTVTCSPGQWTNSPTGYSYGWQRDATTAIGGSSDQYTLTAADVGQLITCTVVASNLAGSSLPAISLPIIPTSSSGSTGGAGTGTGDGRIFPAGSPSGRPPFLTGFGVSPHRMIVNVSGKRQSTSGVKFFYGLDSKAFVLALIQQRLPGKVAGKSCIAPGNVPANVVKRLAAAQRRVTTIQRRLARAGNGVASLKRQLKNARRSLASAQRAYNAAHRRAVGTPCARFQNVSTFWLANGIAGFNTYRYPGLVGKALLGAGSYRVYVGAVNSNGWSRNIKSDTFSVVRQVAKKKAKPKRKGHGPRR